MKEKASHVCYAALRLLDERLLDQVTLNFHWGAPLVFRSNPTRIARVCICIACIVYSFVFDIAESFIHNQGEARQLLSDKKHAARSDKARRRTEHTMSGTAWCFESYRAQLGPCSVHYAQCHYFQVMSNIFQVKHSLPVLPKSLSVHYLHQPKMVANEAMRPQRAQNHPPKSLSKYQRCPG